MLNRTLLIRPHSRFSVYWNFVMVVCAVLEIFALVLMVRNNGDLPQDGKKNRLIMQVFVTKVLSPTPIHQWEPCRPENYCVLSGPRWHRHLLRLGCFFRRLRRTVASRRVARPRPWYCSSSVALVQTV